MGVVPCFLCWKGKICLLYMITLYTCKIRADSVCIQTRGLVSKENVLLRRWGNETQINLRCSIHLVNSVDNQIFLFIFSDLFKLTAGSLFFQIRNRICRQLDEGKLNKHENRNDMQSYKNRVRSVSIINLFQFLGYKRFLYVGV